MSKNITVTTNDYNRLMGLIKFRFLEVKMPQIANRLLRNLTSATTESQAAINSRIVTMNSRVRLREMKKNTEAEITITYPQDAWPRAGKISVLSDVGLALLGREEKDNVSWKTPGGIKHFEIIKVTYQPEASGQYHL